MSDFAERLAGLDGTEIDVVIIGAGINGAGLFRDLCEQGVGCLIADKGDFGSGTSAAPSRLIHGGLKYLETGELRLVAQSTLERNLLLRNAPHLVHPLPTIIPIFSWTRGIWPAIRTLFGSTTAPRSRGALLIKAGLALYDYFGARHRVMPRHRLLGRKRALAETPGLTERIVAAATYYDARVTAPERLIWELVRDGLEACDAAAAANWTELALADDGALTFTPENGATFTVRPKVVVNAAGPWIDAVNRTLCAPTKLIGGTKGSHILLDHDDLLRRLNGRMLYFEADDGRICLIYDYLGRALVGSTDIPASDPDTVRCEDEEIDYLLQSVRALFPNLAVSRRQIVYAYSGIRPLPVSNISDPGAISRDHSAPVIEADNSRPFPIISLVGGKWTTFRGFAEEAADKVLARLARPRRVSTRMLAIGGGREFPVEAAARKRFAGDIATATGLTADRVARLLGRYGTAARPIAKAEAGGNEGRLADAPDHTVAEIEWIVRNECVTRLEDLVKRRTTLAIEGRLSAGDLERMGNIAAAVLGWDGERTQREIRATREALTTLNRSHLA